MSVVDTIVRLGPIVSAVIVAILGAQLWRIAAEKRKMAAEAKRTDADSAGAIGAAALQLLDPYTRAFRLIDRWSFDMNARMDRYEDRDDEWEDWGRYAIRTVREYGLELDPPPGPANFGPRPALHPLVDRGNGEPGGPGTVRDA